MHLSFSWRNLLVLACNCAGRLHCAVQTSRGFPGGGDGSAHTLLPGCSEAAYGFPLEIKIYYILCSSAESTLIIVAHVRRCKCFLMHTRTAQKASGNQRSRRGFDIAAPR